MTKALCDGGAPGILNPSAVESALARPYHGYHRHIHEKAAALVHGIVSNHGFVDGNKRTALVNAVTMESINGTIRSYYVANRPI